MICPVVAVIQWRQEIARYTAPGSVKVLLYHGAKRGSISAQEMQEADIVLTTYSTLENDYRRCIMPAKVACRCVEGGKNDAACVVGNMGVLQQGWVVAPWLFLMAHRGVSCSLLQDSLSHA